VRGVEHDGNLIGAVGFIEGERAQAEMGYWIGKPWWGNGFATEAARAMMDYCFRDCGIRRITCGHFADNAASARVIAKLGFRRVGTSTQWCEARKSKVETIKYARRRPFMAAWWRSAQ
jgi:RimJ/RimL family protein N-acetyltransferase